MNARSLDRIALGTIAVSVVFIALVSTPFYRWLLVGAILSSIYGYITRQRDLIVVSCLTPVCYLVGWLTNYAISCLTPHTIDSELLRIDHGIGISVWAWCVAHPASYIVLKPVYYGQGFFISAGMCFTDRRPELVRAILVGAIAGLICYFLFPAVGPIWVGYPGALRNCMPSLHLTWALLLLIYSNKFVRVPMLIFAFLTAVATLGLGEHYAIDLVAAIPFTAAVCATVSAPLFRGNLRTKQSRVEASPLGLEP